MQHLDKQVSMDKDTYSDDEIECHPLIRFENSQRNTHAQGGTEGDEEEGDDYDMMDILKQQC